MQEVSCGSAFFYAPLTTRTAVDAVQMSARELDAVFKQAGVQRRGIFVFTTEGGADGATVYSRMVGAGSESGHRVGQRAARLLPREARAGGPLGCRHDRERPRCEDGAAQPQSTSGSPSLVRTSPGCRSAAPACSSATAGCGRPRPWPLVIVRPAGRAAPHHPARSRRAGRPDHDALDVARRRRAA